MDFRKVPHISSCSTLRKSFNLFWPSFFPLLKIGSNISLSQPSMKIKWMSRIYHRFWGQGDLPKMVGYYYFHYYYLWSQVTEWLGLSGPGRNMLWTGGAHYCFEIFFLSIVLEGWMQEQSFLPSFVYPSLRMYAGIECLLAFILNTKPEGYF